MLSTSTTSGTSWQLPSLPRLGEPPPWSFDGASALALNSGGVSLALAVAPSAALATPVAQSTGSPGTGAGGSGGGGSSSSSSSSSCSSSAIDGAAGSAAQAAAKKVRPPEQKLRNAAAAVEKRQKVKKEQAAARAELLALRAENAEFVQKMLRSNLHRSAPRSRPRSARRARRRSAQQQQTSALLLHNTMERSLRRRYGCARHTSW